MMHFKLNFHEESCVLCLKEDATTEANKQKTIVEPMFVFAGG